MIFITKLLKSLKNDVILKHKKEDKNEILLYMYVTHIYRLIYQNFPSKFNIFNILSSTLIE